MSSGQSQRSTWTPQSHGSPAADRNWDATKSSAPANLLQKGFELAYFLVPNRSTAIAMLVRALDKLRARSRREMKRLYWRDKHTPRPIRRIARGDIDMLQWLIMFESEQDERAQERAGSLSSVSMAIRYIKHLIQITTSLSSFYVNVGVTRLLHNYSTSEAQRVYEILTPRFLGPDEYRRAKSSLMERISERFAGFLTVIRVDHGELRFETFDNQELWVEVVRDSLKAFTPWSTHGECPQSVVANGNAKVQPVQQSFDTDQNEIELRCCHVLIEPTCYSRLIQELALDAPETRLTLPRFVMPDKQEKSNDGNDRPPRAPALSREELDEIEQRLASTDARRRTINPGTVRIIIDGVERAHLDLARKAQMQISLETGASLVEIHGEDDRGDVILATHFIPYVNDAFELSRAAATLGHGTLRFEVTPKWTEQQAPQGILALRYDPRTLWTRLSKAWQGFASPWTTIRPYAVAGLATALIGWGIAGAVYWYKVRLLEQQLQLARHNQQQLSPTAARAIISYALTPDDQRVRGSQAGGIPEISLRLQSAAIGLELPAAPLSKSPGYSADITTFAGDQTLMTLNFLQPIRTNHGYVVDIVVPVELLKADTYYTVHLHSPGRTDLFTFKAIDNR